jgi:hypothetical protein
MKRYNEITNRNNSSWAVVLALGLLALIALLGSGCDSSVVSHSSSWAGDVYTVRHDGHLFIKSGKDTIHHPDCPCAK